ncbi:MAG: hypothetical protein ABFR36_03310 [Acidobacteriota bacterium]
MIIRGIILKSGIFVFIILHLFLFNLFSNGVVNGTDDGPDFFNLSSFNGALVFQYQRTHEEDYLSDVLSRDFSRNYLEGGLELNFVGSVYHPNLLTFNVDLNLIANRSENVYFSDELLNNSLNNTFNINFSFLKRKMNNLQIYAQKNFGSADRRFSERFFLSSTRYGLKLTSSNKTIPIRVDVFRNTMLSESLSYLERNEKTDNIDLKADLSKITGARSMLRLKGQEYSESIYNVNYRSFYVLSDYINAYGNGNRNSVSGIFSLRKMSGDLEQEVFRININHRQYLRDNLYLFNYYRFIIDNTYKNFTDQHLFRFSLNHRLFNSLDSRISTGLRLENLEFQKLKAFNVKPEFNYRKKIQGGGINILYSNKLEKGNYSSESPVSYKSGSYSFSFSNSLILSTPGIDPESIRITDSGLSILYMEGIDYNVEIFNSSISIIRIPGGSIPRNGRIRISYDFLSFPDFEFTRSVENFNLNLNMFKYFHFFFRYDRNSSDIVSEYIVTPYINYLKKTYGLKFASKFIDGEYSFEDYNSDISGYKSYNLRISLGFDFKSWLRINGNISRNRLDYDSGEYFMYFDSYYASLILKPSSRIYLNIIYRDLRYETYNYFRNRQSLISKLQWNFRKISLDLFYEHILNEYGDISKDRNYFALRLRRMF